MRRTNEKSQKKHSIFRFLIVVGALTITFFFASKLVRDTCYLIDQREVLAKLEEQKQELMISNAEKKELIEKSDQDEFVERIAREYFDFAYPDEQIYIDISGS